MKEISEKQQKALMEHFFGENNAYDYSSTDGMTWADLVHVLQK